MCYHITFDLEQVLLWLRLLKQSYGPIFSAVSRYNKLKQQVKREMYVSVCLLFEIVVLSKISLNSSPW